LDHLDVFKLNHFVSDLEENNKKYYVKKHTTPTPSCVFSGVTKKTPEVNQLRSLNFEGQKLESSKVQLIDSHEKT